MSLVIETDLGNDPDDFFAICWLIAAGVEVKGINLVPGNSAQVAIAEFLVKELNLEIEIGVSKLNNSRSVCNPIHQELLAKYEFPLFSYQLRRLGSDILKDLSRRDDQIQYLIIGPATSTARYFESYPDHPHTKLTMQGGFLPYTEYDPTVKLDKFELLTSSPSFNFDGDRKAINTLLSSFIEHRAFVGKNVCHTLSFDQEKLDSMAPPSHRAGELFVELMQLYLQQHSNKLWHDPTAALLHLFPQTGIWVRGYPVRKGNGWTTARFTFPPTGDLILADLHRDKFWSKFYSWGQ